MSIRRKPFRKWDAKRLFWTDPILTVVERAVAVQLLDCMNDRFETVETLLDSQGLIASRLGCWRETVNRAVRKLQLLGYYSTTWQTVQRKTSQGVKGVTRVRIEIGPVIRQFVEIFSQYRVSAGKPRGVTSHHPPRTPPGDPVAVSGSAVANSTDRTGARPIDFSDDRRRALAGWKRLAGSRPRDVTQTRSHLPIELIRDPAAYRRYLDGLEEEMSRRVK